MIPKPGQLGVFWQTQGSGKSYSMVFFAQKVLRKVAGNWTFVVVTDRVELDDQIAKTLEATGAVSEAVGDQCYAASGAHLRELLCGRLRPRHRFSYTSPMSTLELEPAARARRLEMLFQSRLHCAGLHGKHEHKFKRAK